MNDLISVILYLLAVINPMSKIFVLSSLTKEYSPKEVRLLSLKSSFIGLIILLLFIVAGNIIFIYVFHITVYSFRITAGIILFVMGFRALSKGVFFEKDQHAKLSDMTMVPLVSPLIAGPGMIATSMSVSAEYGIYFASFAVIIAVLINLVIMLYAGAIGNFMDRFNIMGALIRMAGIIVATIALQMILTGITEWYHASIHVG